MQYYVNDDELMYFNYNGVSSTSFFMVIEDVEGLLDTFERDIELVEIQGRDGELIIDNQRKKSKDITITGHIDVEKSTKTLDVLANEIENWLQGVVSYKPLIFKDHKYKYEALCFNQINLSEIIEDLCEFKIIFRVTPNVEVIA